MKVMWSCKQVCCVHIHVCARPREGEMMRRVTAPPHGAQAHFFDMDYDPTTWP